MHDVQCFFFFRAFRGGNFPPLSFKFPPQTITKFVRFFGCFSHFLSPQKQFPPPQNYVSRKTPDDVYCESVRVALFHSLGGFEK